MTAAEQRSWLAGLIGHGVGPSLTPEMHEREAARQGLRYVYKVIDQPDIAVDRSRLERLLAGAVELGFDGLNVTHPAKQAMVPLTLLCGAIVVWPDAILYLPERLDL